MSTLSWSTSSSIIFYPHTPTLRVLARRVGPPWRWPVDVRGSLRALVGPPLYRWGAEGGGFYRGLLRVLRGTGRGLKVVLREGG